VHAVYNVGFIGFRNGVAGHAAYFSLEILVEDFDDDLLSKFAITVCPGIL